MQGFPKQKMEFVGYLAMSVGFLILILLLGEPGDSRMASWEGEKGGLVLWVLLWV